MNFDLATAHPILARTPDMLDSFLRGLPSTWTSTNEGDGTWSPFDVVGHLIHGERTNWLPRAEHLLKFGEAIPFPPFDRMAQFETSRSKSLPELLDGFRIARNESLSRLTKLELTAADLTRTGTHPEFGRVTLAQLLATWVTHDLDHIVQIARCMGRQYADAVGPWRAYLRIVRDV